MLDRLLPSRLFGYNTGVIPTKRLKATLIDILGILLIIAAAPIGWLPGPGGIAVLILGLSLLANNHEWAERLLVSVREHGVNLGKKIFSDDPRVKILLDIVSVIFIAAAVLIITFATRSLTKTTAISLIISAIFLFFGNRKRFDAIKKSLRRKP